MNVRKSLLVAGAVATVGLGGLAGAGVVSAATMPGEGSLVEKIASKFGLNKSDVQAVFDEDRAAHEAELQAKMSERLQSLVDSGKITAAQKTLLQDKQKELQTAHETERTNLESWASSKGIDVRYLMMRGGPDNDDSDRLQELVTDGKVTEAQKKLIQDKQAELQAKHKAEREALQKWASDNNIDDKYLMMGGHVVRGGPGGHAF